MKQTTTNATKASPNRKTAAAQTYCHGCRFWDIDEDECGFDLPHHVTDLDQMPRTAATGIGDNICPCRKAKTYAASYKGRKVRVTVPEN